MAQTSILSLRLYGKIANGGTNVQAATTANGYASSYPTVGVSSNNVNIEPYVNTAVGIADGAIITFLNGSNNYGLDGQWVSNETASTLITRANT
jgi:hypothetical protein